MQTTEIDVVRFFQENVKNLAFGYKICWYFQSFRELVLFCEDCVLSTTRQVSEMSLSSLA